MTKSSVQRFEELKVLLLNTTDKSHLDVFASEARALPDPEQRNVLAGVMFGNPDHPLTQRREELLRLGKYFAPHIAKRTAAMTISEATSDLASLLSAHDPAVVKAFALEVVAKASAEQIDESAIRRTTERLGDGFASVLLCGCHTLPQDAAQRILVAVCHAVNEPESTSFMPSDAPPFGVMTDDALRSFFVPSGQNPFRDIAKWHPYGQDAVVQELTLACSVVCQTADDRYNNTTRLRQLIAMFKDTGGTWGDVQARQIVANFHGKVNEDCLSDFKVASGI
jgi:hypothetical protein